MQLLQLCSRRISAVLITFLLSYQGIALWKSALKRHKIENRNDTAWKVGLLGYPLDVVVAAAASNTTVPLVSNCFNTSTSCGTPLPPFESPVETCHNFRAVNGTSTKNLLQQIHFEQAMDEDCWDTTGRRISYNHPGARNVIDGCSVGIIFPRSLVAYCSCGVWNYDKNVSYFFSGFPNHGQSRDWVMSYANESDAQVSYSPTGRSIRKNTGLYDYPYYDKMMSSRFALAPDGDFAWTYRFLEAIMCGAIPIVPNRMIPEEQEVGYEYCKHGQFCPYYKDEVARQRTAQRNWLRMVPRHSLIKLT